MNEVPKIVHHRLRAATPSREVLERAHSDADVLTAFAEQALVASEREGVLQHLALCADCRDVVALALPEIHAATPAMEAEAAVVEAVERPASRFSWASLSWGHLRWATLAAGIAVAVLVARPALERIGKERALRNFAANQMSSGAQSTPALQIASGASPENSAATKTAEMGADKIAKPKGANGIVRSTKARVVELGPVANQARAIKDGVPRGIPGPSPEPPIEMASTLPQPDMQHVGNMAVVNGIPKRSADSMKKGSLSGGVASRPRFEFRTPAAANKSESDNSRLSKEEVGGASETVAVVAGTSTVEAPEPSMLARSDGQTVQNAPAIEKAKPALDETKRDAAVNGKVNGSQTSAQKASATPPAANSHSKAEVAQLAVPSKASRSLTTPTPSAKLQEQSAIWTISDGEVQRSLDGGHTWQSAARAPLALLCYANRGQDVWAGGQSGTLLHSADNGATWSAVAVSFNGQSLSSDVIALNFQGPAQIVLSTDTHETWTSADAGKTWAKK